MRRITDNLLEPFIYTLVILLSFSQFSYRFTPLLNSDMAINILMTPGYSLPNDLYAWGQDRGGSLIPLLAHFIYLVTKISPISAVSVVHYGILILGFSCALSIFKTRTSRFFFAIIWFFPPWHFVDLLLFPFGTQVSLMFMGFKLMEWVKSRKRLLSKLLLISTACLMFILCVWVSDLGLILLITFTPIVLYDWISDFRLTRNWKQLSSFIVTILIWSFIGGVFLLYGKSHATKIDSYSNQPFNNIGEIQAVLKIIWQSLYECFSFSSENAVESLYAWLIILGIPVVKWFTFFRNRGFFQKVDKGWFFYFTFSGLVLFLVMIISHWVLLNGVGRRYFVLTYLFFAMVILLMVETTDQELRGKLDILIAVILFTGFISSFYKFYIPKHKPPLVKTLSEFQSLGDIGLIGEYWNAYQSATPDPIRIKATAHDKDYVRNYQLSEEVFHQPKIYVIKDMWLDSFPDTLHQFGHTLIKRDTAFYLGSCWINRYELIK